MAKLTKEQLVQNTGNIWMVEVRESELEWGSSTEQHFYTSYDEAYETYKEINKNNPEDYVPDYYIVASEPRKVKITFN